MTDAMRELDATEIENVTGGGCTCGAANCNTATSTPLDNGSILVVWYNCSGVPVAYAFY